MRTGCHKGNQFLINYFAGSAGLSSGSALLVVQAALRMPSRTNALIKAPHQGHYK